MKTTKTELMEAFNNAISNVWGNFEEVEDISGDIEPMTAFRIDEIVEELTDLIIANYYFFNE